jgi:hypothetical protein
MIDRFDLEQHIMQAWITSEDLDLFLWKLMDSPDEMTEDEIANMLIGIKTIHDARMNKLWNTFEELVSLGKITS